MVRGNPLTNTERFGAHDYVARSSRLVLLVNDILLMNGLLLTVKSISLRKRK